MPTLIACLSSGKGTWTEVMRLLQAGPWTQVFLITDEFGREHFTGRQDHIHIILANLFAAADELKEQIKKQLQGRITDFEVALNLASGSGKEHMALLEAVMELGLNFRLVTLKNNQMQVLGLDKAATF